MNYKSNIIFLLLFIQSTAFADHFHLMKREKKSGVIRMIMRYIPTIVAGGGVGICTGSLERYFENKFTKNTKDDHMKMLIRLIGWLGECIVRNAAIKEIQNDFDDCGIEHKKILMRNLARLSSWGAYFLVKPEKVEIIINNISQYFSWLWK